MQNDPKLSIETDNSFPCMDTKLVWSDNGNLQFWASQTNQQLKQPNRGTNGDLHKTCFKATHSGLCKFPFELTTITEANKNQRRKDQLFVVNLAGLTTSHATANHNTGKPNDARRAEQHSTTNSPMTTCPNREPHFTTRQTDQRQTCVSISPVEKRDINSTKQPNSVNRIRKLFSMPRQIKLRQFAIPIPPQTQTTNDVAKQWQHSHQNMFQSHPFRIAQMAILTDNNDWTNAQDAKVGCTKSTHNTSTPSNTPVSQK